MCKSHTEALQGFEGVSMRGMVFDSCLNKSKRFRTGTGSSGIQDTRIRGYGWVPVTR